MYTNFPEELANLDAALFISWTLIKYIDLSEFEFYISSVSLSHRSLFSLTFE